MKTFRYLRCLLLACLPIVSFAEITSVELKAEQWDIPRHGETLLKQPELGKIVRQWLRQPEARIEIRYPGGEEGELWMRELMDWMIALGIPSSSMHPVPGSGAEDVVRLVLVQPMTSGR